MSDKGRRVGANRWLAWSAVVLLVALVVFEVAALTWHRGLPKASATDVDAVRRFAVAVTSLDHQRLQADLAGILAMGTPEFDRSFSAETGASFTQRVAANKGTTVGVIAAGPRLQRTFDGMATFLVLLDQRVTSEPGPSQAQILRVGLLVTVRETDHRVANLRVL